MIKHINHQNVSTTPFVAAKARALFNIQGDDVVIAEPNVYPNGTDISLDYVDYNIGDPILNGECNIALEQQGLDSLGYEEGITGSGTFNSASDARNTDGTYKSLVHRQTKNAFYNTYNNPTEIFGVEHIDFPLSKTLRNLSDHFRMFTIPNIVFGDKIQPKSVRLYDTLLDDNVVIFDDGYQNLMGGYNLFSRVQEVRTWPSGAGQQNDVFPGTASCICPTYDSLYLTDPVDVYADLGDNISFTVSGSGTPRPITYQWYSGSLVMGDGGQISGSNGPVLYITNITFANQATYSVRAHNAATKGLTSSVAHLYIMTHPPIIGDPNDDYEEIGSNFDFCVTLYSGSSPLYWQWYSGSTLLTDSGHYSGSNTQCLRVNNIQIADSGSYRVMVGNVYGDVTSSWANGHVNVYAPLIVSNPVDQANYKGFTASFSVTASGTMPMTYQWISGSTLLTDTDRITGSYLVNGSGSKLQINDLQFSDSGSYKVQVSNWAGTVYSETASLTVWDNVVTVSGSDSMSAATAPLSLSVGLRAGATLSNPPYVDGTVDVFGAELLSGFVFDEIVTSSGSSDTASFSTAFDSGYVFDVVLPIYGGNDTSSVVIGFDSGYIFEPIVPAYASDTTASVTIAFDSGYTASIVTPTSGVDEALGVFGVTLQSGSVQ